MGLFEWLGLRRPEARKLTLAQWIASDIISPATAAGMAVNEKTALTLPAYFGAVNLISSAIAKLPRKVYRKVDGLTREEVPNHRAAWIVATEPNEQVKAFTFWQTLMAHSLTWGNGYAEIERDGAARPVALWNLLPDRMMPFIEGNSLRYRYAGRILESWEVFHIPGLGYDGVTGYSIVQMARQSLGLGLAAERYGASFFGNNAVPGIVLEHPGTLSEGALRRLKESWNADHQGADRAHALAVLEEGLKANAISIPAKDAQLIETREIQVLDVARWLNINPAMLGYKTAERPGGNYEANRDEYLDNTLDPWLVSIEQECNRKLLGPQQRGTFYIEHTRNAILRTDPKTRAEVQKLYIDMGVMSPAYVAKIENLPEPEAPSAPAGEMQSSRARQAWRRILVDVVDRLTRLETERARKAAKQGPEKFHAWLEDFYPTHSIRLREALEPAVRGWCECSGGEFSLEPFIEELMERSRAELEAARITVLSDDVDARVGRWERERPGEVADRILGGVRWN